MKVTLHKEPFHFILVDDMYTESELKLIWQELDFVISSKESLLGPDETSSALDAEGNVLKQNKGVFLDHMYTKRESSHILRLNRKVFTDQVIFNKDSWFFNHQTYNKDFTLISYYEDGDYYKPHNDEAIVTACTWFWKEPKAFTGGNLFFPEHDVQIEIQNNSCVLFPSRTIHGVTKIEMEDKDKSEGFGRICMSQFAQFWGNVE